jgi:hypothetical protein
MQAPFETDPAVSEFLVQLEVIPWFENLGKPISDPTVRRIADWSEWAGPWDADDASFGTRQAALRNEILRPACDQLVALWESVHDAVLNKAASKVPYDGEQDCNHGPTTAAWDAAYTAALMAVCVRQRRPIPHELQEHWRWFVAGHWPCSAATIGRDGQVTSFVVF